MEKKWGNTHKNYTDKQLEKINNSKVNKFIQNLKNKPIIENTFYNNPLYNMNKDIIKLPNIQIFDNISIYYHILFHELIHSTEHRNRLYDVNSIKLFKQNGVYDIKDAKYYAINEIETEIGAIILSRIFNIHSTINQYFQKKKEHLNL